MQSYSTIFTGYPYDLTQPNLDMYLEKPAETAGISYYLNALRSPGISENAILMNALRTSSHLEGAALPARKRMKKRKTKSSK